VENWPDGSVFLCAGEPVPFICPKCLKATPYDKNATEVTCAECGHKAHVDEFTEILLTIHRPN
jgi:DNA-directed RNA polymerase subunit RPC12/RpoP